MVNLGQRSVPAHNVNGTLASSWDSLPNLSGKGIVSPHHGTMDSEGVCNAGRQQRLITVHLLFLFHPGEHVANAGTLTRKHYASRSRNSCASDLLRLEMGLLLGNRGAKMETAIALTTKSRLALSSSCAMPTTTNDGLHLSATILVLSSA